MNNFLTTIISFFRNTHKINPEDKSESELKSDYFDMNNISLTAALAERLTTLATVDSTIEVVGDNKRAQYLNKYLKWIVDSKLSTIGQICLGTGDCLVKPHTAGNRIGVDIISNHDFVIVDSIGDFLLSVLIKCEEFQKDGDIFERWELHELNETEDGRTYSIIYQNAFKNGKEIPLEKIGAWANLPEIQVLANVDRLALGRFKCPKVNRYNINSDNGVPITHGNEHIVAQVKESYRRFNDEFDKLEPMIFADKKIFTSTKTVHTNGKTETHVQLPKGKESVFMSVNGNMIEGAPMIKEFAPAIRDASLDAGVERNFKMLELFCGFNEGILSKSSLTYTNTDEVKKTSQSTYSFISNFRKALDAGIADLIYAVNAICNANNITPMGDYEIVSDWSDSFVESTTERFNQLLQTRSMDAISSAEFRSWVMNEDLSVSEEKIKEIEAGSIEENLDD